MHHPVSRRLVILGDFFRKNAYFEEEKCGKWKEQSDVLNLIMSSRFDIPVVCEYNVNRWTTVNTTTNLII